MANGYIKLYRKFIQWGWYKNSVCKDLFIHLLCTASYTDFEFQGQNYPAGTLITTYKDLSDALGFSIQQIRTSVKKLLTTKEIIQKTTNKNQALTVVNWGFYQLSCCDEQQSSNNQVTIKQQSSNNQNTPLILNKEIKKNKNIYNILPVSDEPKTEKETKHKYGTYKNVLLSDKDIENLKVKFPNDYLERIENLSEGIELKGYKYKNHYLAVLKWSQNKNQNNNRPDLTDPNRCKEKDYAAYDLEAFEKMINGD